MNDVIVFSSVSVDGYAGRAADDLTRLHRWTEPEATTRDRGRPVRRTCPDREQSSATHQRRNRDEFASYRLVLHPLVLGTGKKLFSDRFPLTETRALPSGVLINTYGRSGAS